MNTNTVPNWMIYDLLQSIKDDLDRKFCELKEDISEFKQQHKEDISRLEIKIEKFEAKIEKLEIKVEKIEAKIDKNTEQINELFLYREKVQISFSKTFAFLNIFFSALIAYFAALFSWKQ